MKSSAKRRKSWRISSLECSKLCKTSQTFHMTTSNLVISVGSPLSTLVSHVLITAERTVDRLLHPEEIEEMDGELPEVIEDLDRAVNVEALRLVKKTGKNSLSRIGGSPSSVASCRSRASAWELRICQGRLPFGPRLYERHPTIYYK